MPESSIPGSSPAARRREARRTASNSRFVYFLFLISAEFMLVGPTGRDDADDFVATAILPDDVNYHETRGMLEGERGQLE